MDTNAFFETVGDIVREIPPGTVATYGQIAVLTGYPGYARLVGRALRHLPEGRRLPCHRVVNWQGRPAPGWAAQRELLEREGIVFKENGCADLNRHRWKILDDR